MRLKIIGGILIALALSIFICIPFWFSEPTESFASFMTGMFSLLAGIGMFREVRVQELQEYAKENYNVGKSVGMEEGKVEAQKSHPSEKEMERLKTENTKLREDCASLQNDKDAILESRKALMEEIDSVKKENQKLSGKIGALNQKIKKLQGKGKK